MHPHIKNLNHIWLHGNEEEKEAVGLVFKDLIRELPHPEADRFDLARLDISLLTEGLEWMSNHWSKEQETLAGGLLEDMVQEIKLRRERDITLI